MPYKPRSLKKQALKTSNNFKALLVTGPRQVGKTTFLRAIAASERKYVTLDNPKDLLLAKDEPEFFLQTYAPPVLIDEIQYAPSLFPYIKMLVDNAGANGLVWMTGSQQFPLMRGVSETLAGRVVIMNMLGFSLYERDGLGERQQPFLPSPTPPSILKRRDLLESYRVIWQGSLPGIADRDADQWAGFYDSYVKTYIERDVRQLANIGDMSDFVKFLGVAAARTGQELNLADMARNVDIAPNTAKAWLSILETSGLVYLLKPYFANISKRLIKRPKLYFMDTGLAAYLASWNSPEALEKSAMAGAFFETFAISEILKSYWHDNKHPNFYYYRDNGGSEIDLLIEMDGKLHPVEVKKTSNPDKDDAAAFTKLERFGIPLGYGAVVCLTDRPRPLTRSATSLSVWDI
jgi:predicted AAA+ superfamily ATPase